MRFTWKKIHKPKYGVQRKRHCFLLWPKVIGERGRWLERARWIESYDPGGVWPNWVAFRWVTQKEYEDWDVPSGLFTFHI